MSNQIILKFNLLETLYTHTNKILIDAKESVANQIISRTEEKNPNFYNASAISNKINEKIITISKDLLSIIDNKSISAQQTTKHINAVSELEDEINYFIKLVTDVKNNPIIESNW